MKGKNASTIVMALLLASIVNIGFSVMHVSSSSGNIVENGSFEQPVVPDLKMWDIFSSIPGWSAEWVGGSTSYDGYTRPSVAYFELQRERDPTNGRETPYGEQWIELDSDWFGPDGVSGEPANIAIYQNLATVPGGVYQLSFAYSPRPIAPDNHLVVKWDGTPVADITASGSMKWTTHIVASLIATSSTTELRFEEAGTADSLGMFLDDVRVILAEIESCDSTGKRKDEFLPTDPVYANGSGFDPTAQYNIYVVNDEATWSYDMALNDVTEGVTQVTTDSNGNILPIRVWEFAVPGKYDIVVDCDNSQTYSPGDVIDDSDIQVTAGFLVVPEYPLGTILGLAMCFAALALYKSKHIQIRISNS